MTESVFTKTPADGQLDMAGHTQKTQQMAAIPGHGTRLLLIQEEEEDASSDILSTTESDPGAQLFSKPSIVAQTSTQASLTRMHRHATSPGDDHSSQRIPELASSPGDDHSNQRTPGLPTSPGNDHSDQHTTGASDVFQTEVQKSTDRHKETDDVQRIMGLNAIDEYLLDEERLEDEVTLVSETIPSSQFTRELSLADEDYDTDLENTDPEDEDAAVSYYRTVCEQMGLAPVEYFLRHIGDRNITMRYRGLGPDQTKAIALSLRGNVVLEHLDISGNWIGPEGCRSICRLLEENDYLTNMVLAENQILSVGGMYVAKMVQVNAGLRRLDLSGNGLEDKCAEALSSALEMNKHLREINLSHNNFTEEGAKFLGAAIGANENLDILNLSWNHLRESGGVEIAQGLKENVRLKRCNLSWNGLSSQGGLAIADALAVNQSLVELDLSGNRLSFPVAARLAKVLAMNESIKILKMGNNLITSSGATALATAVSNSESCEIQLLDLTDVPVDYEFHRTVEEAMMMRPDLKVIHGPVMRAGNTSDDLSKPAIDVHLIGKQPIVVLKEHIIVNDMRVVEILKRYDKGNTLSIAVDDFFSALEELAVPYDKMRLKESLGNFQGNKSGMIFLGSLFSDALTKEPLQQDVT